MSAPQTKPDGFDARITSAYFDLEEPIRDLRHMAAIAWALFDDTIKAPESESGWRTLQISNDEFERLAFAIAKTMNMASDLDKAYAAHS
jgi:hypothetical protein